LRAFVGLFAAQLLNAVNTEGGGSFFLKSLEDFLDLLISIIVQQLTRVDKKARVFFTLQL
jgi:hypothetical protein